MGKKKGRNNNNNRKNKRGIKNKTRNQNQHNATATSPPAPTDATVTPPVPTIPTLSNDFKNLSVDVDNSKAHYANEGNGRRLAKPPIEPGRIALVRNLTSRKEINGKYVKIQKVLMDGRVAVEHTTLPGTDLERTEVFSIKKENLEVQWKDLSNADQMKGEECHICMDTIMVDTNTKMTAGEFSCCGKKMCFKCFAATQHQERTTCPFCNSNFVGLSESDIISDYRARAERGDPEAMNRLAISYDEGFRGLAQDRVMARMWFQKAAIKGHADSASRLGVCYLIGAGGPVDPAEGLRWLHIASDLGNIHATTSLGMTYLYGFCGVPRDVDKAKKLLQKSIDAGDERAIQVSKDLP